MDQSLTERWCWTCEDVIREIQGVPVAIWKVQDQTAIPEGQYRVIWSRSERFKREMPEVLNVPGFSGIRIHSGNTSLDTSGCILVGLQTDGTRVTESHLAYALVASRIKDTLDSSEQVFLEVRNP